MTRTLALGVRVSFVTDARLITWNVDSSEGRAGTGGAVGSVRYIVVSLTMVTLLLIVVEGRTTFVVPLTSVSVACVGEWSVSVMVSVF